MSKKEFKKKKKRIPVPQKPPKVVMSDKKYNRKKEKAKMRKKLSGIVKDEI